jgi:hypothetical protein
MNVVSQAVLNRFKQHRAVEERAKADAERRKTEADLVSKDAAVKCAHCGGNGKEIAVLSLDTGNANHRMCGVCKGTGKVAVERSHFTEYPDRSLEFAHELMRRHGKPAEICIAGNHDIRVLFKDGSRYILGGFTVGYQGTGPDYTKVFLDAAGFHISIDNITDMRPPVTFVAGQPCIPVMTLVSEAPTIDRAKAKATDSVPLNAKVIDVEVIRDGAPQAKEGEGVSSAGAVENAKRQIPKGAEVDKEEVVREGKQGAHSVQGYSEQDARESVQKQLLEGAEIRATICRAPGAKGFLGFGRKPGTYEVSWVLPWKVVCKYRQPAAVRIRFQGSEKGTSTIDTSPPGR